MASFKVAIICVKVAAILLLGAEVATAQDSYAGTPLDPNAGTTSSQLAPQTDANRACFPTCRSGFVCHDGQCVSACNPPCGAGQECTSDARCVAAAPQSQPAPVAQPYYPPPPPQYADANAWEPKESPGHVHDGFFLRLGLGVGHLSATAEGTILSEDSGFGQSVTKYNYTISGAAQLGEISLGGSPTPGLVIGGGLYGTNAFSASGSVEFVSGDASLFEGSSLEQDVGLVSASFICAFVEGYPNPSFGFHVGGGPCFTVLAIEDSTHDLNGPGLTTEIGLEGWVSSEWSLGAIFRLQYASVKPDNSDISRSVLIPGLLFVSTFH